MAAGLSGRASVALVFREIVTLASRGTVALVRRGTVTLALLAAVAGAAGEPSRSPDDFDAAVAQLAAGDASGARDAFAALARAGDLRAQDALAGMLVAGIGGDADRERAMGWYCVLAHQPAGGREVAHALWSLAEYYRTGGGLPGRRWQGARPGREDPLRAYFWFRLLSAQGEHYRDTVDSAARLGRLGAESAARQLFAEERARVEARLERWRANPREVSPESCLRLPED